MLLSTLTDGDRASLARTVRVAEGLRELSLFGEALLELNMAVEPRNPAVLAEKIRCHLALGQAGAALPLARWLVDLRPDRSEARELLGLSLESAGEREESLRLFANIPPGRKNPTDWFHEGRLRILAGDATSGRECMRRALELDDSLLAQVALALRQAPLA